MVRAVVLTLAILAALAGGGYALRALVGPEPDFAVAWAREGRDRGEIARYAAAAEGGTRKRWAALNY